MADAWNIEPWCVFGGWRIARARWVRDRRECWDEEHYFLSATVYPTVEACEKAILALEPTP